MNAMEPYTLTLSRDVTSSNWLRRAEGEWSTGNYTNQLPNCEDRLWGWVNRRTAAALGTVTSLVALPSLVGGELQGVGPGIARTNAPIAPITK
jgi:hypothetical protein